MRQHRFFARKAKLVLANLFFRPGQGSKGQAGSRGVEGFQGGPRVEGQGSRGPGGLLWTYMFDHKLEGGCRGPGVQESRGSKLESLRLRPGPPLKSMKA